MPESRTPSWAHLALAPALLVALHLWLLWGMWGALDVNVHDEAHYLRQAWVLAAGEVAELDHVWSLPLVAIHALVWQLDLRSVLQIDVVTVGCALFASAALWWALSAVIGRWPAFAAALWWAATSGGLSHERLLGNSYTLGLGLCSLVIGLVARGRYFTALPFAVLTVLNRGEWSLCFALVGVLWLVASARIEHRDLRWPGLSYFVVGAAMFAALTSSWRARRRSWWTFEQHFAWAHPNGPSAAEAFPNAHSISSALLSEPVQFTEHVASNLMRLPGELARLLFDVAPWSSPLHWAFLALLGALVARGLWQPRSAGMLDRVGPASRQQRVPLRLFFVALAPILVANVALFPRTVLLIPLVPMCLAFLFALARRGLANLPTTLGGALLAAAVLAILCAPPFANRADNLPHRGAVELLRQSTEPADVVFGAHVAVLLDYARGAQGTRAETIDVRATDFATRYPSTRFEDLLADPRVTLLLDTPDLDAILDARPAIDAELATGRWQSIGSASGATLLRRVR